MKNIQKNIIVKKNKVLLDRYFEMASKTTCDR